MDGRYRSGKVKDGEERCDVCQVGDAMIDELEAQRQAYIQLEEEKQERLMDSAIDMPTSSIPFPQVSSDGFSSNDGPFPSSPPRYFPSSTVSFDQGFTADWIRPEERVKFQSQQSQRQQQRFQCQAQIQRAGQAVWDLENRLDQWVGKCPLCYVRKCIGSAVNFQHTLEECVDPEQDSLPRKSVHYKASSFKGMPVVTIVALHNRFVRNGRRPGKGIGSLGRSREDLPV